MKATSNGVTVMVKSRQIIVSRSHRVMKVDLGWITYHECEPLFTCFATFFTVACNNGSADALSMPELPSEYWLIALAAGSSAA
jgi:hypothetical protein